MQKLSNFFELLGDQRRHTLGEIAEKLGIPKEKLKQLVQLLAKEGIISYEEKTEIVKLDPEWNFLCEKNDESL